MLVCLVVACGGSRRRSPAVATAILVAAGFFGATFPIVLAHGRSFVPRAPDRTGGDAAQPVFGIAPIGIAQIVTGRLHAATATTVTPSAPYEAVFLFFVVATALGLAVYLLVTGPDRTDAAATNPLSPPAPFTLTAARPRRWGRIGEPPWVTRLSVVGCHGQRGPRNAEHPRRAPVPGLDEVHRPRLASRKSLGTGGQLRRQDG
jgi:hypothetical protein